MKTTTTILGIVFTVLGCAVALAAAPNDAGQAMSHKAVAPVAAPAANASPTQTLENRLMVELARAVIGVSVLPTGR